MSLPVKDINLPMLSVAIGINVVLYSLINENNLSRTSFISSFRDIENYVPALVITVLVGTLNAFISPTLKARIVFWRWKNPLPGSLAFSKYIFEDPRIDAKSLQKHTELPVDPGEQNYLWYKWYREFKNDQSVSQVQREFLFARDWSSLLVLMMFSIVPFGFLNMGFSKGCFFAFLVMIQYFAITFAARSHGVRFVKNVLACKFSSL